MPDLQEVRIQANHDALRCPRTPIHPCSGTGRKPYVSVKTFVTCVSTPGARRGGGKRVGWIRWSLGQNSDSRKAAISGFTIQGLCCGGAAYAGYPQQGDHIAEYPRAMFAQSPCGLDAC